LPLSYQFHGFTFECFVNARQDTMRFCLSSLLRRAAPLGLASCQLPTLLEKQDDDGQRTPRVYTMPSSKEPQRAKSHAPDWDWNWDYRELSAAINAAQ
jgi:hypothetical protein